MLKAMVFSLAALALTSGVAEGANCGSPPYYPNSFTANTPAVATQVNANFDALVSCMNNLLAPLASPTFSGNVIVGTSGALGHLTVTGTGSEQLYVSNSGTGANNFGTDTEATGAGTNNYAGYFAAANAAANYAIFVPVNFPPAGTNNYALYSASTAQSYFAGNIGLGTQLPSEKLVLQGSNFPRIGIVRTGIGTWYVGGNGSTGNFFTVQLNAAPFLTLDSGGNLGIGSAATTPAAALEVYSANAALSFRVFENGNTTTPLFYSGGSNTINGVGTGASAAATMLTVNRDTGTLRSINAAGTINASGADYAEYFHQNVTGALSPGQVVALNPATGKVEPADARATPIGVASATPGFVGNDLFDPKRPSETALVGLVGQVRTKVDMEGGPISIGDRVSVSEIAGIAKKASANESAIGIAMTVWKGPGVGQILALLRPDSGSIEPESMKSAQLTSALAGAMEQLKAVNDRQAAEIAKLSSRAAADDRRLAALETRLVALEVSHRVRQATLNSSISRR